LYEMYEEVAYDSKADFSDAVFDRNAAAYSGLRRAGITNCGPPMIALARPRSIRNGPLAI
jgi:hypothetical protein